MVKTALPFEWWQDLQLAKMERVNTKHISSHLERREGDVIWRIPSAPPRRCTTEISLDSPHLLEALVSGGGDRIGVAISTRVLLPCD